MLSNFTAYQGRVFDVVGLRGAKPAGDVQLSQTLFGADSGGEVITGVQKLAQRWTMEFLTIIGSMKFLKGRGTDFMRKARQNRFRTEVDVFSAFAFAEVGLGKNLRKEESDDRPDDERYASSELLTVTLAEDFLALTVRVTSLAGTSRDVILPIKIVPVQITL